MPGDVMDFDGSRSSPGRTTIDLVVIGPEDPLAAGLADRLIAGGDQGLRADQGRGADRGGQVVRQGADAAAGGADGRGARRSPTPSAAEEYVRKPQRAASSSRRRGWPRARASPSATARATRSRRSTRSCAERLRRRRATASSSKRCSPGPECSILAFVDHKNIYVMEPAQDHKPVEDGDTGPMTGGMGAYSPTPVVTDAMLRTDRARHPRAGRRRAGARRHQVQGHPLRRPDAHAPTARRCWSSTAASATRRRSR